MKAKELSELGIPRGEAMKLAIGAIRAAAAGGFDKRAIESEIIATVRDPENRSEDQYFGDLAEYLADAGAGESAPKSTPVPWIQWGEGLEAGAVEQMQNACRLPVSVRGALMPDAHYGYGLPIGGVLATRGAVIPYAVGMDIACRMRLSVIDIPLQALKDETERDRLKNALVRETSFGVGARFKHRRQHAVMDEDWTVSPVTIRNKDRAWKQLGTSGSGNHFVEYGELSVKDDRLGLKPGNYLAFLSHSGSRGTGADVAKHYSRLAQDLHRELPKELIHLAWLDIESAAGQEYWAAMELMGRYAAANHQLIHHHIVAALGCEVLFELENHHNFAWREQHDGEEVIVHRKGATPAAKGTRGIIPGSMGAPGYIVEGKGEPKSLNSAAHGAGRKMSRTAAKKKFKRDEMMAYLKERNVELLSAGLDECPMAYKDIDEVMEAQSDLVEPLARFDPRIVRMARG
jgi:tRNA-splicing ligase RtcB (3'-phosphate/5'-hydroxy nucleic acid ligase)